MITVATRNAMLNTITLTHVSLHTDEPGVDGTMGEIDVPRGVVVFSAASGGRIYLTDNVSMPITDPVTITHVGYWNGATFVLSQPITAQDITAPSNFVLQATTTYIEI